MSDFWLFFKIGLEHVLDWKAYDHILFLIALCAAYNFVSWKRLLLLVTLFTVGHTASLLLANYGIVTVSVNWIEFLIPVTILLTAVFNLFTAGREKRVEKLGILYFITTFFGLIHGFGFAAFYKMINTDGDIFPLLEFALGVEVAQIIIVLGVLVLAFLFQSIFRFNKRDWVLVVSSIVLGMVIPILIENWV
jgi:hypothetical protein